MMESRVKSPGRRQRPLFFYLYSVYLLGVAFISRLCLIDNCPLINDKYKKTIREQCRSRKKARETQEAQEKLEAHMKPLWNGFYAATPDHLLGLLSKEESARLQQVSKPMKKLASLKNWIDAQAKINPHQTVKADGTTLLHLAAMHDLFPSAKNLIKREAYLSFLPSSFL